MIFTLVWRDELGREAFHDLLFLTQQLDEYSIMRNRQSWDKFDLLNWDKLRRFRFGTFAIV